MTTHRYFWVRANGEIKEISEEMSRELRGIHEAQRGSPKHKIVAADFDSISLWNSRELSWATLDVIRHKLLEGTGRVVL